MGTDVLLQHAAESRPQVMKSPVKRIDAVTQSMAAKWTHLQKRQKIINDRKSWQTESHDRLTEREREDRNPTTS